MMGIPENIFCRYSLNHVPYTIHYIPIPYIPYSYTPCHIYYIPYWDPYVDVVIGALNVEALAGKAHYKTFPKGPSTHVETPMKFFFIPNEKTDHIQKGST